MHVTRMLQSINFCKVSKNNIRITYRDRTSIKACILIGGAENTGVENAGVENEGVECALAGKLRDKCTRVGITE